jgi:membrane-associated phospholipid phosphatase
VRRLRRRSGALSATAVAPAPRRRAPPVAGALAALLLLTPPLGAATSTVGRLGDVGAIALPVTGLAVAALHEDGKGVRQLAEAYAATMAVVYILKPTIDRTRPNGGSQSFPSGHTASAFAGAAFLQLRYGWAWGAPAYAAATFVGYSRVHVKAHWTTDVLAGGALGIAGNLVFTRRFHKVVVQPVAGRQTLGLALYASW